MATLPSILRLGCVQEAGRSHSYIHRVQCVQQQIQICIIQYTILHSIRDIFPKPNNNNERFGTPVTNATIMCEVHG